MCCMCLDVEHLNLHNYISNNLSRKETVLIANCAVFQTCKDSFSKFVIQRRGNIKIFFIFEHLITFYLHF